MTVDETSSFTFSLTHLRVVMIFHYLPKTIHTYSYIYTHTYTHNDCNCCLHVSLYVSVMTLSYDNDDECAPSSLYYGYTLLHYRETNNVSHFLLAKTDDKVPGKALD